MRARDYNYDDDQNRDYSDLSDQNQSALGRAQERWGNAQVFDGGKSSSNETSNGYDADSLIAAENSATSTSRNQSDESVLGGETSPSNRFNYTGGGTHKSRNAKIKGAGKFGFFKSKKAAILGGVGLLGVSGGFMFFSFFGVMLAPIHIVEIITEKLGRSGSSADMRIDKYFSSKLSNPQGVNCKVKFYCRFQAVSDTQVKNLQKAGFKVELGEKGKFSGRSKIISLTHIETNTKIPNDTASIKKMMIDPKMKASWDKGYRGHFHTFLDKANKKIKNWFSIIGQKSNNKGKSVKDIQDDNIKSSNDGLDQTKKIPPPEIEEEQPDGTKKKVRRNPTPEEDFLATSVQTGNEMKGSSVKSKISSGASKVSLFMNKFNSYINPIDKLCFIFTGANLITSGIKITRFIALARFAFLFMSMASKIKANQATTEEVQSVGDPIMGILSDQKDNNKTSSSELENIFSYISSVNQSNDNYKSFTESQGWRAMAYDDSIGKLDDSASNFTVGFHGWLKDIMNSLGDLIKAGTSTCMIISTVGAGIAIASATALTIAGCVLAAAATAGFALIGCILGGLIKSIGLQFVLGLVAGLAGKFLIDRIISYFSSAVVGDIVNNKTVGQDYGNAVISGAGATMSKNAMAGGLGTLTKEQALAFYFENEKLIAEKGNYERATKSPFDPTSHHTFLGSIFSSTMPYHKQMATLGGFIPAIASIASRYFNTIIPTSSADNAAGFEANMNVCEDKTIKDTGAATDIFCNPIAAIDTNIAKTKTTEEIINKLVEENQLDPNSDSDNIESIARGDFKKYLDSCYDRKSPIGTPHTDDESDFGEKCNKINLPNVDYYSTLMTDIRIDEGLEDSEPGSISDNGSNSRFSGNAKNSDCKAGNVCWPIEGANSGMITPGRWFHSGHNGYDFGMGGITDGTPVFNIADGEVMSVGKKTSPGVDYMSTGYGPNILNGYGTDACNWRPGNNGGGEHFVLIKHNINSREFYSAYSHMRSNTQEVDSLVGRTIRAGVKIGEVGNYGCSSGAHLHFSTQTGLYGGWFDPREVLGDLK